jgi:MFS family permease
MRGRSLKPLVTPHARVLKSHTLHARPDTTKEIEILVLGHQLTVLQRHTTRPPMHWTDRAVIAVIAAFAAASALAAAAPSTGLLISARIGTGLAAALVMPATLAVVSAAAPTPQRRIKAVAGWTAVGALAVAVGPPVGGMLLAVTGWPILFWVNVPLALAAALVLPRATDAGTGTTRLDMRGSLLLAGVVLGIVTAATELPRAGWTGAPVVAGALAAVACATAYAFHQTPGRADPAPGDVPPTSAAYRGRGAGRDARGIVRYRFPGAAVPSGRTRR